MCKKKTELRSHPWDPKIRQFRQFRQIRQFRIHRVASSPRAAEHERHDDVQDAYDPSLPSDFLVVPSVGNEVGDVHVVHDEHRREGRR